MQYLWQHISNIIEAYKGDVPLTHFLKAYTKQYPILGSRDRRMLGMLAYSWYRCSKGLVRDGDPTFQQRMRECLVLCNAYTPLFDKMFSLVAPIDVPVGFDKELLFPHDIPLSEGITRGEWLAAMQVQPRLFIRIRRDKDGILALLDGKDISYEFITPTCLALPNGAAIDTLLPAESYVVQDASSQATGAYMRPMAGERWYDCCSGAGGKSLLLRDLCPGIDLTVSDKRRSILDNLEARFRQYGLRQPTVIVADAADRQQVDALAKGHPFDNILADVPCSGSGTWARTPEQLYYFDPAAVARFSQLQQAIATNVARYVKKGGRLVYITCSVFRQENEDVVKAITGATPLRVAEMRLINGIATGADSMFVAVLQ
ncbi:hypothetical protein GCM10023093_08580 [Nemorincola caseinilytica]|uniref:SAM-dependent MTase RsmB/NOP-type domain-containing protein n=1 Tax=Nemorincola caseinilytica TaxID=2054315 RepID=A0ABP8N9P4_9BACT